MLPTWLSTQTSKTGAQLGKYSTQIGKTRLQTGNMLPTIRILNVLNILNDPKKPAALARRDLPPLRKKKPKAPTNVTASLLI